MEREEQLVRLSAQIEPLVVALVFAAEALQPAAQNYCDESAAWPAVELSKALATPIVACSPLTNAVKRLFWAQGVAESAAAALFGCHAFVECLRLLDGGAQAGYEDELCRNTVLSIMAALAQIVAYSPLGKPSTAALLRQLLEHMGVAAEITDATLQMHGLANWLAGAPDETDEDAASVNAASLGTLVYRLVHVCVHMEPAVERLADALGLADSAGLRRLAVQWLEEEADPTRLLVGDE